MYMEDLVNRVLEWQIYVSSPDPDTTYGDRRYRSRGFTGIYLHNWERNRTGEVWHTSVLACRHVVGQRPIMWRSRLCGGLSPLDCKTANEWFELRATSERLGHPFH
jgi:hypothetical protein